MDRLLLTDGVPRIYTEGEVHPPKDIIFTALGRRVRNITPPVDKPEPIVVE